MAGAAAVALVTAGVAVVAGGGDPGAGEADTATTASAAPSTTTTLPAVTAEQAFPLAAQRLTEAGSFSYSGSVSATDVSHVRPMLWLAVSSTVDGQVATASHRLHEVAVAADGAAAETIAVGDAVWGRRAPARDALDGLAYDPVPGLSGPGSVGGDPALVPPARGAALLPAWLRAAAGPAEI
ncbi:MAG TPA: hypothetical protein VFZ77_03625, partial [Acidimicrobiales bacterium]